MPILQEQKSVRRPASRDIRPPWMAEVQILQDAYMDVGARALQEQVPRKYLPVRPVHRRYICMDAVYADFAGAKICPASCT